MMPRTEDLAAEQVPNEWMNHHNGSIYFWTYILIFLSGPVMYIGVIQAALCDKLGANATLANLPSSAYSVGQVAPLLASWLLPHRLERSAVVWAFGMLAASFLIVALVLILPLPASLKIGIVIAQGLLQGVAISTSDVFSLQCLGRGTTTQGRSRILKWTFTLTPIAAVAGSLGVQYILNPGFRFFPFPYDFSLVFIVGTFCILGVAVLSGRYLLIPLPEEERPPLGPFLVDSGRRFFASKPLLLLWLVYFCWTCSRFVVTNISLYSRHALGRPSSDISGLMMAIQFSGKAIGGFILGWIAIRLGQRSSVLTLLGFLAAGIVWAWVVPGYPYLFAFALIGGTILGGAYIPNYVLTISGPKAGLTNLSILTLAGPLAGFAPALHGQLADRLGFPASFAFGLVTVLLAIWLVTKIRENPR